MNRIYDVFISYNSNDRQEAFTLNRLLKDDFQINTWFDKEEIFGGQKFIKEIEKGLSHSKTCILLIGKNEQGPWQDKEISAALQKEIETPGFRIIPVLLKSAVEKSEVPFFVRENSWVDLREIDGMLNLVKAIRGKSSIHPIFTVPDEIGEVDGLNTLPLGYSADVIKIVELLIGTALYGRDDVCIRELIQNSVDACERRNYKSFSLGKQNYTPKIVIKVNTSEGWFQIDDNGEGMNRTLIRESFATIGKSIVHEENILQRVVLTASERLHLISKFGIGFISTFIISNRVVISTKYEDSEQINFTITDFNNTFDYTNESKCERDSRKIGTTVRVYLKDLYRDLNIIAAVKDYLRHVPYCRIFLDDSEIYLNESWNVENAIVSMPTKEEYRYYLQLGISKLSTPFIISNWGFLVGQDLEMIIPSYMPEWISGEINFWPGVVDLTLSRDSIIKNEKSKIIKNELSEKMRNFILSTSYEMNEPEADSNLLQLRGMLQNTLLFYCYDYSQKTALQLKKSSPILYEDETLEILLHILEYQYNNKLTPLGEIIEDLYSLGYDTIYYKPDLNISIDPDMDTITAQFLMNEGNFVIPLEIISQKYRGEGERERSFYLYTLLEPILLNLGFTLQSSRNIRLDNLDKYKVRNSEIPINVSKALMRISKTVSIVKMPDADLLIQVGTFLYINFAHRTFQRFLEWSRYSTEKEIYIYLCGLIQKDVNE